MENISFSIRNALCSGIEKSRNQQLLTSTEDKVAGYPPSRLRCQQHLNGFPLENWRRPPGRSRTTWMIHQDLESFNLSLNEAIDSGG